MGTIHAVILFTCKSGQRMFQQSLFFFFFQDDFIFVLFRYRSLRHSRRRRACCSSASKACADSHESRTFALGLCLRKILHATRFHNAGADHPYRAKCWPLVWYPSFAWPDSVLLPAANCHACCYRCCQPVTSFR